MVSGFESAIEDGRSELFLVGILNAAISAADKHHWQTQEHATLLWLFQSALTTLSMKSLPYLAQSFAVVWKQNDEVHTTKAARCIADIAICAMSRVVAGEVLRRSHGESIEDGDDIAAMNQEVSLALRKRVASQVSQYLAGILRTSTSVSECSMDCKVLRLLANFAFCRMNSLIEEKQDLDELQANSASAFELCFRIGDEKENSTDDSKSLAKPEDLLLTYLEEFAWSAAKIYNATSELRLQSELINQWLLGVPTVQEFLFSVLASKPDIRPFAQQIRRAVELRRFLQTVVLLLVPTQCSATAEESGHESLMFAIGQLSLAESPSQSDSNRFFPRLFSLYSSHLNKAHARSVFLVCNQKLESISDGLMDENAAVLSSHLFLLRWMNVLFPFCELYNGREVDQSDADFLYPLLNVIEKRVSERSKTESPFTQNSIAQLVDRSVYQFLFAMVQKPYVRQITYRYASRLSAIVRNILHQFSVGITGPEFVLNLLDALLSWPLSESISGDEISSSQGWESEALEEFGDLIVELWCSVENGKGATESADSTGESWSGNEKNYGRARVGTALLVRTISVSRASSFSLCTKTIKRVFSELLRKARSAQDQSIGGVSPNGDNSLSRQNSSVASNANTGWIILLWMMRTATLRADANRKDACVTNYLDLLQQAQDYAKSLSRSRLSNL